MIKNIYDKNNKQYSHEYFCDNCFAEITYGRVYRNEEAIKRNNLDLCWDCKSDWDSFEKFNEELGKGKTNE